LGAVVWVLMMLLSLLRSLRLGIGLNGWIVWLDGFGGLGGSGGF